MEGLPDSITIEICTPGSKPASFSANEAMIPGREGVFTVRPGHTPLLAVLDTGVLITVDKQSAKQTFYAVNGGFAEVSDNHVLVLTQTAEEAEHIDLGRAEAALERAERRLKVTEEQDLDAIRAELALRRAMARIQAGKRVEY